MINLRVELNMRNLEGIFGGKSDTQTEYATFVGCSRRTKDNTFPVVKVILYRTGRASRWRIPLNLLEFFLNTFKGHIVQEMYMSLRVVK
jgi:hypothetical protein